MVCPDKEKLPNFIVFSVFSTLRELEQAEAKQGYKSYKTSASEPYQKVCLFHFRAFSWP